uniref:Uncharacterized protein n=1 Tax=Globisporangium ultimum (strain ATCC 200006 / CBS 805.95 / DAOM BR144) TaxID=431595 RepID=K3X376_GLOUD
MMEESVVGDFANRLKLEFEDRDSNASDMDECQDWFVNDATRTPSPTKSDVGGNGRDPEYPGSSSGSAPASPLPPGLTKKPSKLGVPVKKSNTAETADEDVDECGLSKGRTAFLHHIPQTYGGILVMELGASDQVMERRYSAKFFRIYVPQVHESQTDFCLFARKRLNKHKYRFSLEEDSMSTWTTNSAYGGKVLMTPSAQSKKFKLVVPKNAPRVHFDIDQEARKQELVVRLNSQPKRFNLFRGRASSDDDTDVYRALIQKFINPVVEVRCPKSNATVFKIEKEGDVGSEKYIVTYMRPFSLFVSCCIAVGVEAHLFE